MKPEEIKGLNCPHCDTFITPEDVNANTIESVLEVRYKCEICGEVYEDKEDAETCCEE